MSSRNVTLKKSCAFLLHYFLKSCKDPAAAHFHDSSFKSCYASDAHLKDEDPIMSFFQTILDSIENPNHAGSQQDLSGLLNLAHALPLGQGQGAQQNLQPILGVLGAHLQDALGQQQQSNGQAAVQQTVTNLSQPGIGLQELENLFGQERFNGLINEISQRTGLNSELIMGLLPMLIPVLMKLLATGNHQTDPEASNPVLNHFLGSGQDGGALLTEAFQLASRFLQR
jgi:hypothetical protein